jgi:hypothetical protein
LKQTVSATMSECNAGALSFNQQGRRVDRPSAELTNGGGSEKLPQAPFNPGH